MKYRIDRVARQRQDKSSSYPNVTFLVVRRADACVMSEHMRKRDALRRADVLEAAHHGAACSCRVCSFSPLYIAD